MVAGGPWRALLLTSLLFLVASGEMRSMQPDGRMLATPGVALGARPARLNLVTANRFNNANEPRKVSNVQAVSASNSEYHAPLFEKSHEP